MALCAPWLRLTSGRQEPNVGFRPKGDMSESWRAFAFWSSKQLHVIAVEWKHVPCPSHCSSLPAVLWRSMMPFRRTLTFNELRSV